MILMKLEEKKKPSSAINVTEKKDENELPIISENGEIEEFGKIQAFEKEIENIQIANEDKKGEQVVNQLNTTSEKNDSSEEIGLEDDIHVNDYADDEPQDDPLMEGELPIITKE